MLRALGVTACDQRVAPSVAAMLVGAAAVAPWAGASLSVLLAVLSALAIWLVPRAATEHLAAMSATVALVAATVLMGTEPWQRAAPGPWTAVWISFTLGVLCLAVTLVAFHDAPHGRAWVPATVAVVSAALVNVAAVVTLRSALTDAAGGRRAVAVLVAVASAGWAWIAWDGGVGLRGVRSQLGRVGGWAVGFVVLMAAMTSLAEPESTARPFVLAARSLVAAAFVVAVVPVQRSRFVESLSQHHAARRGRWWAWLALAVLLIAGPSVSVWMVQASALAVAALASGALVVALGALSAVLIGSSVARQEFRALAVSRASVLRGGHADGGRWPAGPAPRSAPVAVVVVHVDLDEPPRWMIRELRRCLDAALRDGERTGRWGEGVRIVLPAGDLSEARRRCTELVDGCGSGGFDGLGPSLVFGAAFDPAATVDTLQYRADAAALQATKAGGRLLVVGPDRPASAFDRLDDQLSEGLRSGQLALYYQPVVRSSDGAVAGVEALIRWNHPDLGLLSGDAVVGAAVRAGLLVDLGRWVLARAGRDAEQLRTLFGVDEPFLAINLSTLELEDEAFVEHLVTTVEGSALADLLAVEITEGRAIGSWSVMAHTISRLQEIGVTVGIDDFGAGHANLTSVAELDLDFVKIDRGLVLRWAHGARGASVLGHAVDMARSLGVLTIAEGIEDEAWGGGLCAAGVHLLQGYGIARPQPLAELLRRDVAHR